MLEIKDLHVHYGGIHALRGISLNVEDGKIISLIGANGAGKSTTLKAIMSLTQKTSGSVIYDGKDMTKQKQRISSKAASYSLRKEEEYFRI